MVKRPRAGRRTAGARPIRRAAPADGRLTRERIVDAALAVLDRRGVHELSMRTLADALGTAPMSLYRHVRSKDDLLKAIVARVLERLELDVPARGPWTTRAAAWMHALRDELRRSPQVVSILMQHGHYAPALLRATNTLLRILRDAGFEERDAVRASREITWSTLGFVSAELRGPTFSPAFYVEAVRGTGDVPPEDVAEVAAHMPHLMTRDLDDVFGAIVRHLLAGLAGDASASRRKRA